MSEPDAGAGAPPGSPGPARSDAPSARPSPWTPAFTRFFAAQSLSWLGSAMTPVAISLGVLEATGRLADLGLVLAANSVPMVLLLLVGGVVADRWPRGRLLVVTHAVAALTQIATAAWFFTAGHHALADGRSSLMILLGITALNGAASAFTGPALRGIIAELVPPAAISAANGARAASRSAFRLLGPALAGVLVAGAGAGWALAIDAACLVLAAILLATLPRTGRVEATSSTLADLREGIAEFASRRWLGIIAASFFGVNLLIGGIWLVLAPAIALGSIGAAGWGIVLAARAGGLLAGGAIGYRWSPQRPLLWCQLLSLPYAAAFLALALAPRLEILLPLAVLAGIGSALDGIVWESTLQQKIPGRSLSRVASIDMLLSFASIPLGQILAPLLAAGIGERATILAGTAVFMLALLLPLLSRTIRTMRSGPAEDAPI